MRLIAGAIMSDHWTASASGRGNQIEMGEQESHPAGQAKRAGSAIYKQSFDYGRQNVCSFPSCYRSGTTGACPCSWKQVAKCGYSPGAPAALPCDPANLIVNWKPAAVAVERLTLSLRHVGAATDLPYQRGRSAQRPVYLRQPAD